MDEGLRVVPRTEGWSGLGPGFDETLRAARDGVDDAWARLYRDLAGPLLGYLRSQRAPDPEDLVGEVLLQVVRDLPSFSGDEDGFRAWVFTIAHRRLIDARRKANRRPVDPVARETIEPALPPAVAEPEALEALSTEQVLALLDRLTEDQREVLVLRLVAGLRGSEIAEVTGRDIEAVKGLVRRGIERLRDLVGGATPVGTEAAGNRPPPSAARER